MRIGEQKRRIEIQRPTMTTDDLGGQAVTFTPLGLFWARVRRVSGNRALQNEATTFNRPFEIMLRDNIEILEKDLIIFDGMNLVVQSVEKDYDKFRYQFITATAKTH